MTYELFIGDRTFSSWSLRGWLLFEKFNIPHQVRMVGLYGGTMRLDLAPVAPARLVPAILTPEGEALQDTLAIAETLAERHPEANMWPKSPQERLTARWLAAEMHSGFAALREECPMNLQRAWRGFEMSEAVAADLARVQQLWEMAAQKPGTDGPWLFGSYSIADVFYAPVAARIAGYGLEVSPQAQAYVQAHLQDHAFRRWRAMGLTHSYSPAPYEQPLQQADWPGPTPLAAEAVTDGTSCENQPCPYSGKPVTHFMKLGGRVFGFCNAFCRDKTVRDPAAWPAFMKIYET